MIYPGKLAFDIVETRLDELPEIQNQTDAECGFPFHGISAFRIFPMQGVGLAREEFIINNYIGIHPMALLTHKKLNDDTLVGEY